MIRQNEIEEIIKLIYDGFDLELLAFELDIPIEQVKDYKKQLKLRQFAKESIKNGKINVAIEKLIDFIESSENNIVERVMLLKLKSYVDKTDISEEDLQEIELKKKEIGFNRDINEILNELKIQIPKRKSSNIRKKQKLFVEQPDKELVEEDNKENEETTVPNYEEAINKYKNEIEKSPEKSLNKRNLLAFTYFRANRINEARNELLSIIKQCGSYLAYRQLIHLEKEEGNLDDAKLWAYEATENFPNNITIREQLISIAREENDTQEIIKLLKEIIEINPDNEKIKAGLKKVYEENEK